MENKIYLTPKQKILLEIVKEQGFITIGDIRKIYSSDPEGQLKRLISLGVLQEDRSRWGKFIFPKEE